MELHLAVVFSRLPRSSGNELKTGMLNFSSPLRYHRAARLFFSERLEEITR